MKRFVLASVALSICGWWWFHSRETRPHRLDVARSERVLADLAGYGGGIRWFTSIDPNAITFRTIQEAPATVAVSYNRATIETGTWRIVVNLDRIHDIVCERQFIHHPEPGFVWLKISFRKGPDKDSGFPDELFTAQFDEANEADLRALCERHGLRKDGDGW